METGLSSDLVGHIGPYADFTVFYLNNLLFVIFTYLEIVVNVLSLYKTPNKTCLSVYIRVSVPTPRRSTPDDLGFSVFEELSRVFLLSLGLYCTMLA